MKKIHVVALMIVLVTTMSFSALAYANRANQRYREAGENLADVIELIMTRYVGRAVTVEELVEAATRYMYKVVEN